MGQSRQKPCWKSLQLLHLHTYALVKTGRAFWTSGSCSDESSGNSHRDNATYLSDQSIRHKKAIFRQVYVKCKGSCGCITLALLSTAVVSSLPFDKAMRPFFNQP